MSHRDAGELEYERHDDEHACGSVSLPAILRATAKKGADRRREIRVAPRRLKDANCSRFGAAVLADHERGKDERLDAVAACVLRVVRVLAVVDLARPVRSLRRSDQLFGMQQSWLFVRRVRCRRRRMLAAHDREREQWQGNELASSDARPQSL